MTTLKEVTINDLARAYASVSDQAGSATKKASLKKEMIAYAEEHPYIMSYVGDDLYECPCNNGVVLAMRKEYDIKGSFEQQADLFDMLDAYGLLAEEEELRTALESSTTIQEEVGKTGCKIVWTKTWESYQLH